MNEERTGTTNTGPEPDHDALRDLVAVHSLDALEPEEISEVEEHLVSCASCREEYRALRETATHLSVPVAAPPPASLRGGVLDAITETPQQKEHSDSSTQAELERLENTGPTTTAADREPGSAAADSGERGSAAADRHVPGSTAAHAPGSAAARGPRAPTGRRTRERTGPGRGKHAGTRSERRIGRRGLLAGAAGIAAAAVVGVGIGVTRPWMSEEEQRIEAVLEASDATSYGATIDGAEMTLVRSPEQDAAVVLTEDMPPAPQGQDYQMWYLGESGAQSAGLVRPGEDGAVQVLLEGSTSAAAGAAMSVEPEGGSEQPTTEPAVEITFS